MRALFIINNILFVCNMFTKSPKQKRRDALSKLINRGYRYVLLNEDKVFMAFWYEREAIPYKRRGMVLRSITELINEI